MNFTKMQGIGNDYIYIDCFREAVKDPAALSIRLSDRHFGVGSDGVILIEPSEIADCKMDMYNADGSRGMMCGNGIRCVGKYVYERGIAPKDVLTVETLSGIKTLHLDVNEGRVGSIEVDMGSPILKPAEIPMDYPGDIAVDVPLTVGGKKYQVTCVSMGNPHCVVFVDDAKDFPVEQIGPVFERLPVFPEQVNTEFVQVIGKKEIRMRVWERGSGETLACGTGACASAVACMLNGKTERSILVHLLGGDLEIRWDEASGSVFMKGPAEFSFDGTVEI